MGRSPTVPLILLLTAGLAVAQQPPPPFTGGLGSRPVAVELDGAEVRVVLGFEKQGSLQVTVPGDGGDPAQLVEVTARGGKTTVARTTAAEAVAATNPPRLRLELALAPGQRLSVRGRDLRVSVETAPVPEEVEKNRIPDRAETQDQGHPTPRPADEGDGAQTGGSALQLEVERSSVDLSGVSAPALVTVNSFVRLDGCLGSTSLRATGGSAQISGHHGKLNLNGDDAELTVSASEGPIDARLAGGSLLARDGHGNLTAELNEALLQADGWRGALGVKGGGTCEVRRSTGTALSVNARGLDLLVEEWGGTVHLQLEGGGVRGGGWKGRTDLALHAGATADVAGVQGELALNADGDSAATLSGVQGPLRATLNRARLDARGVKGLHLTAVDAEVAASEVTRVDAVEATRSALTLDLTGVRGPVAVNLRDGSTATVRLSSPCEVRTLGPGAALGTQATVSGCEHRPGDQRWTVSATRGLGGERPVTLLATLAESARIEVSSSP